jgi:peptide/nickel transport system permease protein
MTAYFLRRIIFMFITLIAVTVVGFIIIQLPPGDFLTSYIVSLEASGEEIDESTIQNLRARYGLDLPAYMQYFKWVTNMIRGDLGVSFQWNKPVSVLIGERLALTVTISILTLIVTYIIAIPIGIFSATHQYSIGDYFFTFIGFTGLATPNFLFALFLLFIAYSVFGANLVGLFSQKYINAPWSMAKAWDMIRHLPIPLLVIGLRGTAGLIRVMRGSLLDELRKQYVVTARSKGISERKLLFKYPVRIAINPIVSTVAWMLPQIISGATIVSIVLNLPTIGPLLFRALTSQDMYLAGAMIVLISFLAVMGTFISDMLLMKLDPRIRYIKQAG